MEMRCLAGLAALFAASAAAADTIFLPAGGDIQKAINMGGTIVLGFIATWVGLIGAQCIFLESPGSLSS